MAHSRPVDLVTGAPRGIGAAFWALAAGLLVRTLLPGPKPEPEPAKLEPQPGNEPQPANEPQQ